MFRSKSEYAVLHHTFSLSSGNQVSGSVTGKLDILTAKTATIKSATTSIKHSSGIILVLFESNNRTQGHLLTKLCFGQNTFSPRGTNTWVTCVIEKHFWMIQVLIGEEMKYCGKRKNEPWEHTYKMWKKFIFSLSCFSLFIRSCS